MTRPAGVKSDPQANPNGRRWSWPITIAGILALVCLLIASLWGYDRWANSVPASQPSQALMPSPNGYERAVALLAQLPPEPSGQGVYRRWPEFPAHALWQALAPAEPALRALRQTLRLPWQRPLPLSWQTPADLSQFRGCARYLFAESLLAEQQGDASVAMQRKLDCMEMGAKLCRGGALIPLLVGVAIHAIGFAGTERLVDHLPAAGIPPMLSRVRNIRREWPRYPEFLEAERKIELQEFSQAVREYQHPTPLQTLGFISNQMRSAETLGASGEVQAFVLWLTPKRSAFATMDRFFQAAITEYRKPFRRRHAISIPTGPIFRNLLLDPQTMEQGEAKWWRPQVDLDLLEVALAVRLYRLQRGHYPSRLSEIPQQWLPAIPKDPWGQPIAFRMRDGQPVIYSFGPDGRDDGGRPADARQLSQTMQGDLVWGALRWAGH